MGLTKDFLITIHNGGDEAVAAVQRMGDDWRAMLEQAATEIERRWIPVAERLPEPDYMGNAVGVLACLPDGEVCIGFCDNDEYGVRWQCNSTQKPTHWMPLPAPPTDDK